MTELTTKGARERVPVIDCPGIYYLSQKPGLSPNWSSVFPDLESINFPPFNLIDYLKGSLKLQGRSKFDPHNLAGLMSGEPTPIQWLPDSDTNLRDNVIYANQVYEVCDWNRHYIKKSNGDYFLNIVINDLGNYVSIRGFGPVAESTRWTERRDSSLWLQLIETGSEENSRVWGGKVEVRGVRRGQMVQDSIDYMNEYIQRTGTPLWIKC